MKRLSGWVAGAVALGLVVAVLAWALGPKPASAAYVVAPASRGTITQHLTLVGPVERDVAAAKGGRRQSLHDWPSARTGGSSDNTAPASGWNLFNTAREPEKIPGSVPVGKMLNGRFVFIDGTNVGVTAISLTESHRSLARLQVDPPRQLAVAGPHEIRVRGFRQLLRAVAHGGKLHQEIGAGRRGLRVLRGLHHRGEVLGFFGGGHGSKVTATPWALSMARTAARGKVLALAVA